MQFFKSLGLAALALTGMVAAAPTMQATVLPRDIVLPRDTSLNPRSSIVFCYNSGAGLDRGVMVQAIDWFCGSLQGQYFSDGREVTYGYNWSSYQIVLVAKVEGSCGFTIDSNCNRIMRLPIDTCNTSGVGNKQGGFYREEPACQWYRIDPNQLNSRLAAPEELDEEFELVLDPDYVDLYSV